MRAFAEYVEQRRLGKDGVCFAISGDTMLNHSNEVFSDVYQCAEWIYKNGVVVEDNGVEVVKALKAKVDGYGVVTFSTVAVEGEIDHNYRVDFQDGMIAAVTLNDETGTLCITSCSSEECKRDWQSLYGIE